MSKEDSVSPIPTRESSETSDSEAIKSSLVDNSHVRKNLESEFKQVSVRTLTEASQIINVSTTMTATNAVPLHATSSEARSFSVHLRLRPASTSTLELINSTTIRAHPPRQGTTKDYTFSNILPANTSQFDVYQQTTAPLVQGLFGTNTPNDSLGSSALLFCYGITNAGKTYTVTGDLSQESKWGVLPRALQDAFHRAQAANLTLQIGFMEIYNEQVFDLLQPQDKYTRTCPQVKIRENQQGMAVCKGLVQVQVESVDQGLALITSAKAKRQTCSNNLNSGSSRSHCICQLTVLNSDNQQQVSMWIVDLAGSERAKRTDAGQMRLKEASQINKSLMTLMRCLMALRDDPSSSKPKERPPYRDSKITHLLMNHLTGPSAGRTIMIVNVHPAESDYEETQHVLQYAAQAKYVVVQANANPGNCKRASVQYGENGRRIVPQGQGKMAKLLAKLSPLLSPGARARKRKGEPTAKDIQTKKIKPGSLSVAVESSNKGIAVESKELRRLKMQISVLQVDNQNLKQINAKLLEENDSLKDQLEVMEENIRAEVVEEMESKQAETNGKYESIINGLKHSLRENSVMASTTKSTRKKQLDRAEEEIEDLMERLEVCEADNKRLIVEHNAELETLKVQHHSQLEKLQSQIKTLRETISVKDRDDGETGETEGVKDIKWLSKELQLAQAQILALQEENRSLRQILGDGDEEDSHDSFVEDESVAEDDSECEDKHVLGSEKPLEEKNVAAEHTDMEAFDENYVIDLQETKVCSTRELGIDEGIANEIRYPGDNNTETVEAKGGNNNRFPFSRVIDNDQDEAERDSLGPNMLLFPKNGAKKDKDGHFLRPKGRKPKNAEEWDSHRGAWRLSMVQLG